MACVSPASGWLARSVNPSGRRGVVFDKSKGFADKPMSVRCGRCVDCRLEKSRQIAVRADKEASLYVDNCYLTLTYRPEVLPLDGSLVKNHMVLFNKRVRKRYGAGIRFFYCGEYGDLNKRPHFHSCVFNFDFADKVFDGESNGFPLYSSAQLQELWPWGRCWIGGLTFESAAYVARYVCKKIMGRAELDKFNFMYRVDHSTGEVNQVLVDEFCEMPRRPGLGKPWFDKFWRDVFPHDFIVSRGVKMRAPDYFLDLLEVKDPAMALAVKRKRCAACVPFDPEFLTDRLRVKERVIEARFSQLKRSFNDV